MENVVYIHGILGNGRGKIFKPSGWGKEKREFYTISHWDISAVVSQGLLLDFNRLTKEKVAGYLYKHQTVLEEIMKRFSVLPVKFGIWVSDDLEVEKVLNKGYWELRRLYIEMDYCVEFEVVATWVKEKILKDIFMLTPEIQEIQRRIAGIPDERSFQDKIRLGQLVQSELLKRRETQGLRIKEVLSAGAIGKAPNDLLDDFMVLNTAFLVQEEKGERFNRLLQELDREYHGTMNFRCIGPLPPYSFATVEVKNVEYKKIEKARLILGLDESATILEIKNSHRNLARQSHPDVTKGQEERFDEANWAFRTLLDYCQGTRSGLDLPSGIDEVRYSFREEDVKGSIWVQAFRRQKLVQIQDVTGEPLPGEEGSSSIARQSEPIAVK